MWLQCVFHYQLSQFFIFHFALLMRLKYKWMNSGSNNPSFLFSSSCSASCAHRFRFILFAHDNNTCRWGSSFSFICHRYHLPCPRNVQHIHITNRGQTESVTFRCYCRIFVECNCNFDCTARWQRQSSHNNTFRFHFHFSSSFFFYGCVVFSTLLLSLKTVFLSAFRKSINDFTLGQFSRRTTSE